MEFKPKPWLIFLFLALAVVAESTSLNEMSWDLARLSHGSKSCNGAVGECIGEENELLMESNPSRILARRRRYISYRALRANQVPCGRRGHSYYNCQRRRRANPYRRGCNVITHCARRTGWSKNIYIYLYINIYIWMRARKRDRVKTYLLFHQ